MTGRSVSLSTEAEGGLRSASLIGLVLPRAKHGFTIHYSNRRIHCIIYYRVIFFAIDNLTDCDDGVGL